MLGHKDWDFGPLTAVSLEDLVSEYKSYRQVNRSIDLTSVGNPAFVPKSKYSRLFLEVGRSKFRFINSKQRYAMPVQ